MSRMIPTLAASLALVACDPSNGAPDAQADSSCSIEVALGLGARDAFIPIDDGDATEVILGFQGFRMLRLSTRVIGSNDIEAELSSSLSIEATGVQVSQRDLLPLVQAGGAGYVEDWLFFFNDAVPA